MFKLYLTGIETWTSYSEPKREHRSNCTLQELKPNTSKQRENTGNVQIVPYRN